MGKNKDKDHSYFESIQPRNTLDYMLRTMQQNHVQLSLMADHKASILLGAEVVMLTVVFGLIKAREPETWSVVLAFFILASAIFALMAVTPRYRIKLSYGVKPNWLFFAYFGQISPDEYMQHMEKIAADDARIYRAIVNDIYQMGAVLYQKKFRYLNYSYKALFLGIAVSSSIVAYDWFTLAGAAIK